MSQLSGIRSIRVPGVPDASISERDAGAAFEPMQAVGQALSMFGQLGQQIAVKEQRLDDQKLLLEIGREARESSAELNSRLLEASSPEEVADIEAEIGGRHETFIEKSESVGSQEARQEIQNDIKLVSSTVQAAASNRRRQIKVSDFRVESDEWARKTLLEGVINGDLGGSIERVASYYRDNVSGLAYSPEQAERAVSGLVSAAEYQDGIAKIDAGEKYDPTKSKFMNPSQVIALRARMAVVSEQEGNQSIRQFESRLPFVIESGLAESDPLSVIGSLTDEIDSLPYSNKIDAALMKKALTKEVIRKFTQSELSSAIDIGDPNSAEFVIEDLRQYKGILPKSVSTHINGMIQEAEKVQKSIEDGKHADTVRLVAEFSKVNNVILSEVARGDGEYDGPYSLSYEAFRKELVDALPKEYRTFAQAMDADISRTEYAMVHSNIEEHAQDYARRLDEAGSISSAINNMGINPSTKNADKLFRSLIPEDDSSELGVDTTNFKKLLAGEELDETTMRGFMVAFSELRKGIPLPNRLVTAFSESAAKDMPQFAQDLETLMQTVGFTDGMIPVRGVAPEKQLFAIEYIQARGSNNSVEDSIKIASQSASNPGIIPEVVAARLGRKRLGLAITDQEKALSFIASHLLAEGELEGEDLEGDPSGVKTLLENYGESVGMDAAQAKLFSKEAESFENLYLAYLLEEVGGEANIPDDFAQGDGNASKNAIERATGVLLQGRGETSYALNMQGKNSVYSGFAIEKYFGNGVAGEGGIGLPFKGTGKDMWPVWYAIGQKLSEQGALQDDHFWNQVLEQAGEKAGMYRKLREHLMWHVARVDAKRAPVEGTGKFETAAEMYYGKLDKISEMSRSEFENFRKLIHPNLKENLVPRSVKLGGRTARDHGRGSAFSGFVYFGRGEAVTGELSERMDTEERRLLKMGLETLQRSGAHHMIDFGFPDKDGSPMRILKENGDPYDMSIIPLPSHMAFHPDAWKLVSETAKREINLRLERALDNVDEPRPSRQEPEWKDTLEMWGKYQGL